MDWWTVFNVNPKPFHKCECFAFGILLLNTLRSNLKMWDKQNFSKNKFSEVWKNKVK